MASKSDKPVRLEIIVPFSDGIKLPVYIDDQGFVPSQGRNMSLYEFFINPATAAEAAHFLTDQVRKQTKLPPGRIVKGFLDQMWQGATLSWSEEAGAYIAAIPAYLKGGIKSGAEDYEQARADYMKKTRADNELTQFLMPNLSATAQSIGMSIPIGAAMVEPTPLGEAAVGAYGATRAGLRAFNPFAIAGTTTSATFTESILKAMVISGAASAGAAEGYWKDRLASVPAGMRDGMEWGLIANGALFGTIGAFKALMRIPGVRSKLRDVDFHKRLGKGFLEAIEKGDEAFKDKFNARSQEVLVTEFGLDTGKLMSGKYTHEEIVAHIDDSLKGLRERAAVESELTLGELAGPRWKAEQLQSMVDDPASALKVREQFDARELGEPARVSAALRETQPSTLLPSATEAVNLRQSRVSGTRTDPISGEVYPVERPGLLGAEPLPLKPTGGSQGVSGIYYQRGYTANDIPLKGEFMKTFKGWDGWEKIYEKAQSLRNTRIYGPEKDSPAYTANGLSNELPAWQDFLRGVRYIPKSTAKDHGTAVNQQLNPKTGLWQEYKVKAHKGWETRTRVVFDDFKVIEQQQHPETGKWSDVKAGRKPKKGRKTRQKTVEGSWAVRLNKKSISFETLHDMRKGIDVRLGALEKSGDMTTHKAEAPYRTQLDTAIKRDPDMGVADNYFSAFKKMEAAAASGRTAWDKSLGDLKEHYNRMGVEQKRMFRTAMIQTAERKGFSSTQLSAPTGMISSEIAEVPGKMRMLYPEGKAGDAMYQQAKEELRMSARMQETSDAIRAGSSHALVKREPQGWIKTLALMAKLPAYSFSMEFALGRDLIAKARKVDAAVNTGVARNLNRILATKSGPEASAMIDELASTAVRMQGNIPAASSLRAFADTLRSVGAYSIAGQEVSKTPPMHGTMTGIPEGEIDIQPGLLPSLLEGYEPRIQNEETGKWEPSGEHPYDRTYPATEIGSSLLENLGVPAVDYLKEKVPYWWDH